MTWNTPSISISLIGRGRVLLLGDVVSRVIDRLDLNSPRDPMLAGLLLLDEFARASFAVSREPVGTNVGVTVTQLRLSLDVDRIWPSRPCPPWEPDPNEVTQEMPMPIFLPEDL